jgi:uncharacterized protein (DUF2147 family)
MQFNNRFLLALLISLGSFSLMAQADLSGKWNTGEKNTIVQFEEVDGVFIGKIISSGNKKVEPGTLIIKEVVPEGDHWSGKIFSLKRKKWYDTEISSSGYSLSIVISVGYHEKTIRWTKESD